MSGSTGCSWWNCVATSHHCTPPHLPTTAAAAVAAVASNECVLLLLLVNYKDGLHHGVSAAVAPRASTPGHGFVWSCHHKEAGQRQQAMKGYLE